MRRGNRTAKPPRLRVCGVSDSAEVWALLAKAAAVEVPGLPHDLYRATSLREVLADTGPAPDLLLADLTGPFDDGVAASQQGRALLARQPSIVLCGPAQQVTMFDLAREGVIADFFPIGGSMDLHYLQFEIWRALRQGTTLQSAAPTAARPAADRKASDASFNGMRALIIEDDLASRTLLSDYLEVAGFDCTIATSVAAACLHHRNGGFNVIVLDLYMPGVSGSRAVRTIREHFTPDDLPIVVTSAYSDVELVRACIKEGISAYLVKPLRKAVVLDRLRAILL